ncbi:HIT family protein [Glycomyces buryatensis]|uniref:HIT family protein n=1 Tax=Glycomyces buryatensis TaxID=2570927 RepID=A0A4S8PW13_9ACTN|nr:HIT family protein [Glycomyces buryatensis]THV34701.1 HIT family protein [Glycomyces buryatensis]
MDDPGVAKVPFDIGAYVQRTKEGPCFICALVSGESEAFHEIVFEDRAHVAFLSRYPTLAGYTLVSPKRHIEDAVGGFTEEEYLAIQAVVRKVGLSLQAVLPVERVYVLSLGSRQGNAHAHWHVAPLPPGIPYEQQQFHALMAENGIIEQDPETKVKLAQRLRNAIHSQG